MTEPVSEIAVVSLCEIYGSCIKLGGQSYGSSNLPVADRPAGNSLQVTSCATLPILQLQNSIQSCIFCADAPVLVGTVFGIPNSLRPE